MGNNQINIPKGFVLEKPSLPAGFVFEKPAIPKGFELEEPAPIDIDALPRFDAPEIVDPKGFSLPISPKDIFDEVEPSDSGIGDIVDDFKTVGQAAKMILEQPVRKGEIQDRLKNMITRAVSPLAFVIPGVSRRGLIEELDEEARTFTGFGPALVPAGGEAAELAVEWTTFQKLFGITHKGFSALGKMQRVKKIGEAIKSFRGVKAFADKFPRIYAANRDLLRAFAEGETLGQTIGLLEGLDEGETAGNILKIMNIRGATLGAIAGTFSLASSIDTAIYVKQFRTSLVKNLKARTDAKIRQLPKGKGDPRAKTFILEENLELQQIDSIVAGVEAELIGLKEGKLFREGQAAVESPRAAAKRIAEKGIDFTRPAIKGPAKLKKGLGKLAKKPLLPTTKAGEIAERVGEIGKAITRPAKTAREIVARAGKPAVQAPIPVTKPPTAGVKAVPPSIVPKKPEITAPTEAAEAEKARKPLPEQEVKVEKPQEAKLPTVKIGKAFHGTSTIHAKGIKKKGFLPSDVHGMPTATVQKGGVSFTTNKKVADDFSEAVSNFTKGSQPVTLERDFSNLKIFPDTEEEWLGHKTFEDFTDELKRKGFDGVQISDEGEFEVFVFNESLEKLTPTPTKKTEVQTLAKELEKSLNLSPERALRVAEKKLALEKPVAEIPLKLRTDSFNRIVGMIDKKVETNDIVTQIEASQNNFNKEQKSFLYKYAAIKPPAKPAAKVEPRPPEQVITVEKPIDVKTNIPKAPKVPVTEQEPTIPLKGKEVQVFLEEVKTQEKITAAEEGEVGIEPAGASFTDHIDTFHTYQLPETSKIPRITKEIKRVNGLRLSGKITPQQANRRIHNLRQELLRAAIKEKIALRVNKKGKVKIALRESGVFVPEEVATYGKYKNIQPIIGGGQDITRAIQQMDGSLTIKEKLQTKGQAGIIERFVLWRTRKMTLQKLNWLKEKTVEIRSILESKKGSEKDKEINLVLEKIGKADRDKPIKEVLSKKTLASFSKESIKAAQELRQFYDDVIEEQNAARLMRSQDEIPYRQNYSPNILRDTTFWEQLFLRDKTAKVLEQKDLLDYIKPNAPFNPRAQAREADIPYDKRVLSARELAESYIITAAKDIFNTSIIQNNKAFIEQLKGQGLDKSAEYLGEWTATSFAGIKPRLDRAIKIPKWAQFGLRYFNRLRNMAVFPFNVAWSLSTQPLSLSNTIGRYGLPNTIKGFFQWLKPSIRKQAAQDYFSFIVKSTKRGGVTRQDAANLLGENIKTQKTVGEFVENFSTILLTEMEKLLTGMSIRTAHIQGKKRGLKGEALKNFASDGGAKTQSMYNDEDKPMILRSLLVKSAAPYQTYAFEVANTFREWAGKTGTPPSSKLYAMWSVTRWLAAMIVLRMLANIVRGKKWSWWDLIPIPFREFWLSPIARKLTGEFIPGSSGLPSPIETATKVAKGVDDVLETGNWRKLRNETLRYAPGIVNVPGGVQISRMTDAIIVYSSGGLTDRRGKVLFEMKDPDDLARAMFTGVWTTKEAQALLERRRGKGTEKKKSSFEFGE